MVYAADCGGSETLMLSIVILIAWMLALGLFVALRLNATKSPPRQAQKAPGQMSTQFARELSRSRPI
jgi:hypothetical protein